MAWAAFPVFLYKAILGVVFPFVLEMAVCWCVPALKLLFIVFVAFFMYAVFCAAAGFAAYCALAVFWLFAAAVMF